MEIQAKPCRMVRFSDTSATVHQYRKDVTTRKTWIFSSGNDFTSRQMERFSRCWYLLTSWSRVLLEKLTRSLLVEKFPAFYGNRRFITAFTSALHLSLFWARSIQSMLPHPTSWRSVLILSSHLFWVFQVVSFPEVSPPKPYINISSAP